MICPFGSNSKIKNIANLFIYLFIYLFIIQKTFSLNNWNTLESLVSNSTTHSLEGSCLLLGPPGSNWCFSFAPELVGYSAPRDLHRRAAYSICESWFLIHQDVYHDLFVCS